ncbi:hypothetical protein TIFTF001_033993 [Ficus carica]|uniref:Uncharacterized protein n=1 Tax=Ficus carica TaxID=3494 RepID=A0AA88DZI5_FICCA|nr:hypothetical protein TIFTF001_033993 [Ficus carica]
METTPAPDTVASRFLSDASLLDTMPLLFWSRSCSSLNHQKTNASSLSSMSLSSRSMFARTSMSSSRGLLPLALSILAREHIYG